MYTKRTIYIYVIIIIAATLADIALQSPFLSPFLSILLCAVLIREHRTGKWNPRKNHLKSCDVWDDLNDGSIIDNYMSSLDLGENDRALAVLARLSVPKESYPHKAAREVLKQRLNRMIRKCDLIGKKGSTDFLAIFGSIDSHNTADSIARRLMWSLSEEFIHKERAYPLHINLALVPVSGKDSSYEIESQCRKAMEEAKSMGPNTFFIAGMSDRDGQNRKTRIEIALKSALKNEEMEVYLQPKMTARTEEMVSVEALVRWTHPTLGKVSPQEFIPIAERIGLIGDISRFVYYHSFEMLKKLESLGYNRLRLSLNVSPVEIHDGTVIKNLTNGLFYTGVDPHKIDLEVTEGFLLTNSQSSINMLEELKLLGFNISIDDFGTGYSSFSYLKNFTFDTLKIDKSFIDHIQSDQSSLAIVKSIIALSQVLKLKTVAEGVEDENQVEILKDLGCDLIQGYYFGRPMNFDDFIQHLEDRTEEELRNSILGSLG